MKDFCVSLYCLLAMIFLGGCMSIKEMITPTRTPLPQGDSTGQLELTVNLGKKVYHVGEEIIPYAKIRNTGTNNVLIRNKFSPGFDHNEMYNNVNEIFLGPNGKPVMNTIIDIYYLPYADSDLEFQVIYANHEFNDSLNRLDLNYRIQKTGKYTYQIQYRNHLNPTDGREAWKGTLTSNVIEFEIIK